MTPSHPTPPPPSDTTLILNVATLLSESIGARRTHTLPSAPSASGAPTPTPPIGTVQLLRTDQSIVAVADLQITIQETCGACLNSYDSPLTLHFEEEFWPDYDPLTLRHDPPPPDREGFPLVAAQLDLREAVRQYVEMARPMSPRCRPDCPGPLDPPDSPVDAAAPPIDSRWAALQPLRNRWR